MSDQKKMRPFIRVRTVLKQTVLNQKTYHVNVSLAITQIGPPGTRHTTLEGPNGIGEKSFKSLKERRYNRMKRKHRGGDMDSWKKAVIAASVAAATVLFVKRKMAGGVLAGGVALAVLAAEYPEKFEQVREALPDYFDRGMHVMEMAAKAGRRISEASGKSLMDAWEEM